MASEIGIASMFLIQTGLALLTVLGACFCITSHFFLQPTPHPHRPKFREADWVPSYMQMQPRRDNKKPVSAESRTETRRPSDTPMSEDKAVRFHVASHPSETLQLFSVALLAARWMQYETPYRPSRWQFEMRRPESCFKACGRLQWFLCVPR